MPQFCQACIGSVGSPCAFLLAIALVIALVVTGPILQYSDTWQLGINATTTIVTFLMVFLIQDTQNRGAKAIHLKLDELIKNVRGARNSLIDLEDCTETELRQLEEQFTRVKKKR